MGGSTKCVRSVYHSSLRIELGITSRLPAALRKSNPTISLCELLLSSLPLSTCWARLCVPKIRLRRLYPRISRIAPQVAQRVLSTERTDWHVSSNSGRPLQVGGCFSRASSTTPAKMGKTDIDPSARLSDICISIRSTGGLTCRITGAALRFITGCTEQLGNASAPAMGSERFAFPFPGPDPEFV